MYFLIQTALVSLLLISPVERHDDLKTEEEAKKIVDQFLKAVKAGKPEQLTPLVGVPWLADEKRIVKDEQALKKLLGEKFGKPATPALDFEVGNFIPYPFEDPLKDEASKKLLDEILGKKGGVVLVKSEKAKILRYLLVQRTDAGPKVVGGPYPLTYLLMPNPIPLVARNALEKAETVELFSLDPSRLEEKPKNDFHGWRILGQTTIKENTTRKKLFDELRSAAESSQGFAALCFNPRHGLRLKYDGKTIDFVICFECL